MRVYLLSFINLIHHLFILLLITLHQLKYLVRLELVIGNRFYRLVLGSYLWRGFYRLLLFRNRHQRGSLGELDFIAVQRLKIRHVVFFNGAREAPVLDVRIVSLHGRDNLLCQDSVRHELLVLDILLLLNVFFFHFEVLVAPFHRSVRHVVGTALEDLLLLYGLKGGEFDSFGSHVEHC